MSFGQRLVVCTAVAILAAGCDQAGNDINDNDRTDRPATGAASPGASSQPGGGTSASGEVRSMGGELGAVNSDQQTFTLMVDGKEQSFRFSDATQVSGAAGTQGLAGRKGSRVTVYYRDSGGTRIADRIILADSTNPR